MEWTLLAVSHSYPPSPTQVAFASTIPQRQIGQCHQCPTPAAASGPCCPRVLDSLLLLIPPTTATLRDSLSELPRHPACLLSSCLPSLPHCRLSQMLDGPKSLALSSSLATFSKPIHTAGTPRLESFPRAPCPSFHGSPLHLSKIQRSLASGGPAMV